MADAQTIIQSELHPDETLIWTGQPEPYAWARAWWKRGLMGILFLLFSIFPSWQQGGWPIGILLIGIGLWAIMSPLWQYVAARWVFYGVTNQRVLILTTWPTSKAQSFYAYTLGVLERKWMQHDGRGTLVFSKYPSLYDSPKIRPNWGLYGIDDVKKVEGIIHNLQWYESIEPPAP